MKPIRNFWLICCSVFVSLVLTLCLYFVYQPVPNLSKESAGEVVNSKEYNCMVEALYFEIRNGDTEAMQNVADVIVNRTKTKGYPETVCKVISQHKQFSYKLEGKGKPGWQQRVKGSEQKALERVKAVAGDTLARGPKDATITHYHTHEVKPGWAKRLKLTLKDNYHRFYKDPKANQVITKEQKSEV